MNNFKITGNIVDIYKQHIFWGSLQIEHGFIVSIVPLSDEKKGAPYILPGFIDSHVHIESSMLVPSEFARLAVVHGTVGTVSDPHEIANVCGLDGVHYMIENAKTVPLKFCFGAPSCVPATQFETAGAAIDADEINQLLSMPDIHYLSEMMNFPGVLHDDAEVMKKITWAKHHQKPIDGHAPGLTGKDAKKYIEAGITTDHECFTYEEAREKLSLGMKIIIREGSAAKNFDALIDLLNEHADNMMFCSDDKHPDSLAIGHINQLCARAAAKGISIYKILQAACINPVKHYAMNVGTLKENDPADFIIVNNLSAFDVIKTFINGQLVAENGVSLLNPATADIINQFDCPKKLAENFSIPFQAQTEIPVIAVLDGQLITHKMMMQPTVVASQMVSDTSKDLLKIVVVNRYRDEVVAKAFITNTGIKKGALASSVAHDSHNIVAVGVSDEMICKAVNAVIEANGGIAAVDDHHTHLLALPVAGLMSVNNGYEVANAYTAIDAFAKNQLGSTLSAPFMSISFMALLVIPALKLSDKGLFDGNQFSFVDY